MDDDKILDMPLHVILTLFIIELNEMEDAVGVVEYTKKVFDITTSILKVREALMSLSNERLITESVFHQKHYKVSWHGKELLITLHKAFNQYGLVCKRALAQKTGRCVE